MWRLIVESGNGRDGWMDHRRQVVFMFFYSWCLLTLIPFQVLVLVLCEPLDGPFGVQEELVHFLYIAGSADEDTNPLRCKDIESPSVRRSLRGCVRVPEAGCSTAARSVRR